MLKTNLGLQKISLARNKITNSGAFSLAQTLETTHVLREINLRQNKISTGVTVAFGVAKEINPTLEAICCDAGAYYF